MEKKIYSLLTFLLFGDEESAFYHVITMGER